MVERLGCAIGNPGANIMKNEFCWRLLIWYIFATFASLLNIPNVGILTVVSVIVIIVCVLRLLWLLKRTSSCVSILDKFMVIISIFILFLKGVFAWRMEMKNPLIVLVIPILYGWVGVVVYRLIFKGAGKTGSGCK